jgi:hypothetical protein
VGKILAGAGIFAALFVMSPWHPQLAILFVFIYFAGDMEYRMVKRKDLEDEHWRRLALLVSEPVPPPLPEVSENQQ